MRSIPLNIQTGVHPAPTLGMKHSFRTTEHDQCGGLVAARRIMVNMPAEVFDIWLGSLIGKDGSKDGWPFIHAAQPTYGTRWHQYFDGHSIQTISNLRWHRERVLASPSLFGSNSRKRLQWIIDAHLHGLRTPCSNLKEGKGRESFLRSRDFVARTGKLHTPAVLIKQAQGLQIMDGNHRLAAFFSLYARSSLSLDCWVGDL